MANEEREKCEVKVESSDGHGSNSASGTRPYHPPTFTTYGRLSELVQTRPGVLSDGGTADCNHR
jgi:hypothetical protein